MSFRKDIIKNTIRIFGSILIGVILIYNITPNLTDAVYADIYGFDSVYFIDSNNTPRDVEVYLPTTTTINLNPVNLNNHGSIGEEDITEITLEESLSKDYTYEGLSRNSIRMLSRLGDISSSGFLDKAKEVWGQEGYNDVFSYQISNTEDGKEYLDITVKDFSKGFCLTDIFNTEDESNQNILDVLEINTGNNHGFTTDILQKGDRKGVVITPKVKNPGRMELLIGGCMIVTVRAGGEVKPIGLSIQALKDNLSNISDSNTLDPINTLPKEEIDNIPNNPEPSIDVSEDNKGNLVVGLQNGAGDEINWSINLEDPNKYVKEEKDTSTNSTNTSNKIDNYVDNKNGSTAGSNFFSTLNGTTNKELVKDSVNELVNSNSSDSGTFSGSSSGGIRVKYKGKWLNLTEIPKGYEVVDGELVAKKLDLSSVNLDRITWGVSDRIEGDKLEEFANVDRTGNSLLENVMTSWSVEVDDLYSGQRRQFYEKPLPVKYHRLEKSEMVVVEEGKYNRPLGLVLMCAAVLITIGYFFVLRRFVKRTLKDLEKSYILNQAQLTSEIDTVSVENMTLD